MVTAVTGMLKLTAELWSSMWIASNVDTKTSTKLTKKKQQQKTANVVVFRQQE